MQDPAVFPAVHSTLDPQPLAREVIPLFGTGPIAECRFYTSGFNDTYQARAEDGGIYYCRVYRYFWRTKEDILFEMDVLNHLKAKGKAVAWPLALKDGEYIHPIPALEGQRFAAVFPEAKGHELSYEETPEADARLYGEHVAAIHNAVDDFSSSHPRFHLDLDHFIDTPMRRIQPFLADHPEKYEYIRDFALRVKAKILALPADELEYGFCHGDFQGGHAYLAPDDTFTFFDFDCCGLGYRAYDLAVFRWAARLSDKEDLWWEPYIEAYQQVRPLKPLDLEAIPLFVCCRYLWHMGVHAQNTFEWGWENLGEKYFNKRIGYIEQLEQDYRACLE